MKKVLLFSSLMLLGLGFLCQPAYGQLDRMIKRTKDKTKQKVQKRVERKVDNAVDKTLDEAENSVDGKSKKKKDKKDKKKDKKNKKNKDGDGDGEDTTSGTNKTGNSGSSNTNTNTNSNSNSGNTNAGSGNSNTSGATNSGTSGNSGNAGSNTSTNTNSGNNSGNTTSGGVNSGTSGNSGNSSANSGGGLLDKKMNTSTSSTSSAQSDFYPGDYLLFTDDLYGEEQGEFPSKWNLLGGSAENSRFDNSNVISFYGIDTEIMPLLRSEEFLPEVFTVEFDAYFYANGNGDAYFIKLKGLDPIKIVRNSAEMGRFNGFAKDNVTRATWRKVAMSYNQGSLKLYLDHNRVLNIPKIGPAPTSFAIAAVSPGARSGEPAMVRNVRVAMGGQNLYDYFLTEGKIVTRMIAFDEGQSSLKAESSQSLEEIAKIMNDHPESKFSIQCHTDSKGNDALNKTLSEQRAQAVKAELEKRGVASNRMEVKGFGESQPVDTNKTTEGRMNNNRVEFVQL